MIEFQLIDDTETIEVGLIKGINSYNELKDKPSINNVTLEGNKTLDELNIQQKGDYATNTYVNTQLNTKVDKVSGKGLSTNDFTNEYKNNVDSNTSARHTHSNKTVLDNISSTDINNWNNKSTFSGDYNDLSNKPTIPNKTSQITNDSGFITKDVNNLTNYTLKTNTGSLIDLEINTTDYVVTLSLKNQDGTVISTDNIDLPLESVVVSGRYDNNTKKVILTLENGSEVDFSVADLVSGLQTELSSTNKLNSDYVDDTNSGNKFVTANEKTTWNDKYNKPSGGIPASDLASAVQTSLGKADTAIQSSDLTNYVTNTDYATSSVGGVIKTGSSYGTSMTSSGNLRAVVKTYEEYSSVGDYMFVGKRTLENVLTGKGLNQIVTLTQQEYDALVTKDSNTYYYIVEE